ncbi:hypothetical protein DIPPA_24612 [Diplonema papillatum]|nr:hypothetical protein DIPPA_24612 [Diplonema papillatum]
MGSRSLSCWRTNDLAPIASAAAAHVGWSGTTVQPGADVQELFVGGNATSPVHASTDAERAA